MNLKYFLVFFGSYLCLIAGWSSALTVLPAILANEAGTLVDSTFVHLNFSLNTNEDGSLNQRFYEESNLSGVGDRHPAAVLVSGTTKWKIVRFQVTQQAMEIWFSSADHSFDNSSHAKVCAELMQLTEALISEKFAAVAQQHYLRGTDKQYNNPLLDVVQCNIETSTYKPDVVDASKQEQANQRQLHFDFPTRSPTMSPQKQISYIQIAGTYHRSPYYCYDYYVSAKNGVVNFVGFGKCSIFHLKAVAEGTTVTFEIFDSATDKVDFSEAFPFLNDWSQLNITQNAGSVMLSAPNNAVVLVFKNTTVSEITENRNILVLNVQEVPESEEKESKSKWSVEYILKYYVVPGFVGFLVCIIFIRAVYFFVYRYYCAHMPTASDCYENVITIPKEDLNMLGHHICTDCCYEGFIYYANGMFRRCCCCYKCITCGGVCCKNRSAKVQPDNGDATGVPRKTACCFLCRKCSAAVVPVDGGAEEKAQEEGKQNDPDTSDDISIVSDNSLRRSNPCCVKCCD